MKEQLVEVLGTVAQRENRRFFAFVSGLMMDVQEHLRKLARSWQCSRRERIRQIEAKALRKLRHPSRSRKLKDYLD